MNISYYSIRAGFNPSVGYGYAGDNIIKSLKFLGHDVFIDNPLADLQLNFCQPNDYKFNPNQYQIGYTPWETTAIEKNWVSIMNSCDEVWATSTWNADVFKQNGVNKNIKVYPHGVDKIWKPKRRYIQKNEPIRFLHIGEPAPRKSGQLVLDTFIKLFGNDDRYSLTIKAHHTNNTRVYLNENKIATPNFYKNVKVITDEYPVEYLVHMYHNHHVLVYPSWGEGFGFIPLQALATGMPTISTYDWAEYKKFLTPLGIDSNLTKDSIPKSVGHPYGGEMFRPDEKSLEKQMIDVVENYNAYSGYYFNQAKKVHDEYNWIQLTRNAFKDLNKNFL